MSKKLAACAIVRCCNRMRADGQTYQDDLKEHLLVDLHVLLVPLVDVRILLAGIIVVVGRGCRVGLVVLAPFDNLPQDGLVDLAKVRCVC